MPSVCCCFHVHQPPRLRRYRYFDIGVSADYADAEADRRRLEAVATRVYRPANRLLLDRIRAHGGAFRVAFSVSGPALDRFEADQPAVLAGFRQLAETGAVEFLGETDAHSLAFLFSPDEFRDQVRRHRRRIRRLFGRAPTAFRHTGLIYRNDLAPALEAEGYRTILAEGADHLLGWRRPGLVYQPSGCPRLALLLRHYRLSEDIARRFEDHGRKPFPLAAGMFAAWVHEAGSGDGIVNLFMDYETFGDRHTADSGIFEFLRALPAEILRRGDFRFCTPSEAARAHAPVAPLDVPTCVSAGDVERDLSPWLANDLQQDALHALYALEGRVRATRRPEARRLWRWLQAADHFAAMGTKGLAPGSEPRYASAPASPYEVYIAYMNAVADLGRRLETRGAKRR
jgi:alpha-amylase